jgi:hypothetical protein
MLDRTEAAQFFQVIDIDVPVIDFIATLPQQVAHHILTRALRSPRARDCGKLPCGFDLSVERLVHGVEYPPLLIG